MKKIILGSLIALMLLSIFASAEIPRTYVRSSDQTSATIDDVVITDALRPRLSLSYREHFYERREETIDSGIIGLILQGKDATGQRSVLRTSGKATSVEQLDSCNVAAEYNPNYAVIKHGRSWQLILSPTVSALHNVCTGTVDVTVDHVLLGITSGTFNV